MKESKSMKEIHEIREKNYETTKDMSIEDYLKYLRSNAERAKKQIDNIRKSKPKVV